MQLNMNEFSIRRSTIAKVKSSPNCSSVRVPFKWPINNGTSLLTFANQTKYEKCMNMRVKITTKKPFAKKNSSLMNDGRYVKSFS
jgi:hypothetical protein